MNEIAKGRCSGETEKLYTPEEMRAHFRAKANGNNLIYTTRSRQDLDDIWDYISFDLQNLPSAERILNRIMDAAEQLKLFPESGALLSSVAPLDHELYLDERFLVSGKYLIFIMLFGTIFILTASSTAGGIICGFCSGTLCRKNKLFCRASRNVFDRFISGTAGNLHFFGGATCIFLRRAL